MRTSVKELMEQLGITKEELLEDIKKQMSYTYDHRVKHDDYVIAQDKNTEFNDIIILKNGKEVFHASCDKQFSDEELKKYIIDYIQFQKQKEFKGE